MTQSARPRKVVIIIQGHLCEYELLPTEMERLLAEWQSQTSGMIGSYTYQKSGRERIVHLRLDLVASVDVDAHPLQATATVFR